MNIIAIIIALAASAGLYVGSEASLPGNPLYGLKTGVTEEVRAAFSFGPAAQARWAAERADRRLEEAERLSAQGTLDEKARARVEAAFIRHADLAEARIEALAKADARAAAEIASVMQSSLEAHERILNMAAIASDAQAEKTELVALQETVDREGQDATAARVRIETGLKDGAGPDVSSAAEGRREAARQKIREARARVERAKARLGEKAVAQAETRLKLADALMADGQFKLEAKRYAAAFDAFSNALRVAHEGETLIEAQAELRIDVGLETSATAESLVGEESEEDEAKDEDAKAGAGLRLKAAP